ncbi:MAG: hypothetical protein JWN30_2817 [Bacilli bacterium]|nr:hypothetical protein [Bacilli bacterium]
MWLDDSMAAVRTYDVLRAVELAAELRCADASDIRLYGCGKYAIYVGFAGLLEPAIREIRMKDRMSSIADWVKETSYDPVDSLSFIIPGMLRLFDLPDLDGWLADEGRLFATAGRSDSL